MSEAIATVGDPDRRNHIAGLLRRYPALDTAATAELVEYVAHGPVLDIGLLTSDAALKPVIERIREDHPDQFRLSWHRALMVTLVIVLPALLACWLMWDIGG